MRKEQRELLLVVVFASMAPKEEEMIMNETIHQGTVLQQQQVDCRCCRRMAEVASSSVRRSTCRIVETFHCHESGSLFPRAPRKKMIAKKKEGEISFYFLSIHGISAAFVYLSTGE